MREKDYNLLWWANNAFRQFELLIDWKKERKDVRKKKEIKSLTLLLDSAAQNIIKLVTDNTHECNHQKEVEEGERSSDQNQIRVHNPHFLYLLLLQSFFFLLQT